MALFDKLKEKVNQVVDLDKLGEKVSKTVESVKGEVAKAVDPSIREQEQKEQKRREKEEATNAFYSSINVDEELEYIFSVLEQSGASVSNLEKGVEHLISKTKTTLKKEDVLSILKKELFSRAFADAECAVARVVAIDYFIWDVVRAKLLLDKYLMFATSRKNGSGLATMEEPFIKALYGVAGHALNYLNNRLAGESYQVLTPNHFLPVIEESDVLKSYTDSDPFAVQDVRAKWAKDIYKAPLEIVRTSSLKDLLVEEEHIDAMYYFTYITLCQDQEDCIENASVDMIASVYSNYLKESYSRISS